MRLRVFFSVIHFLIFYGILFAWDGYPKSRDGFRTKGYIMEIIEIVRLLETDNPAAATALTEYSTNANNNVTRIGDLEIDLRKSAEKRDKLKHTIRTATGLEEITVENLAEVLKSGDGQAEVYKAEILQLQGKLGEAAGAVDDVSKGYEKQIFGLQLDRVVNIIGAGTEVHNSHAYQVVMDELAQDAQFDGKDIVYKNADGTTIYADGGNPATVKSRYEELRANDDFAYLFKEKYVTGGGKTPTGPTTTKGGETLRRSTMSDEDKVTYIAKNSMSAYKQLPY